MARQGLVRSGPKLAQIHGQVKPSPYFLQSVLPLGDKDAVTSQLSSAPLFLGDSYERESTLRKTISTPLNFGNKREN